MAINLIEYADKQNFQTKPEIPNVNKVTENDMNEIKNIVNANANLVGDSDALKTNNKNVIPAINEIYNLVVDYTLDEAGNQIILNNLDLSPDSDYEIVISGSSSGSSNALTNIVAYPNLQEQFTVSRVAGFENNSGSINSVFNFNSGSLYLGRVILGSSFLVESKFSLNNSLFRAINQYGSISSSSVYIHGSIFSIVNSSETINSLRIAINNGNFSEGTNVKIFRR